MRLNKEQLRRLDEDGLVAIPDVFSRAEIDILRAPMPALFAEERPENTREAGGGAVRNLLSLHRRNVAFARLVRHPRLVEPALQILGEDLYAQQVKINPKTGFDGAGYEWHFDFATHHKRDGVARPRALNLHVFLDNVVEFNGPLYFIPGSHKAGPAPTHLDTATTSYPLWVVDRDTVRRLAAARGLFSATGRAGTALIFGDCLVHGSPPNLSPWERRIFSLILNPIANAYTKTERPDYKHHRNLTPVPPLADDCLLPPPAAAAE